MNPETRLMQAVQLRASELGWRLFRNSTGMAWVGTPIPVKGQPGVVLLRNARRIRFGLCVGSSDLIGWNRDGRFAAIEIKTSKGRTTRAQNRFLAAVHSVCGVGCVIRSVEELKE